MKRRLRRRKLERILSATGRSAVVVRADMMVLSGYFSASFMLRKVGDEPAHSKKVK